MKKKIVIKVSMPNDKSRAKAMALVSGVTGVISMAITGDLKDRLEVVGEGVDAVGLVSCLRTTKFGLCWRKKFCDVEILTVEEVKDKKKEEKKPEKKEEKENKTPQCSCPSYPCYPHPGPLPMVVCEEPSNCSIM